MDRSGCRVGGDNVGPGDVGPYLLWETAASYYYTLPSNKRVHMQNCLKLIIGFKRKLII